MGKHINSIQLQLQDKFTPVLERLWTRGILLTRDEIKPTCLKHSRLEWTKDHNKQMDNAGDIACDIENWLFRDIETDLQPYKEKIRRPWREVKAGEEFLALCTFQIQVFHRLLLFVG